MASVSDVSDIACTVSSTGIYAPSYSEILSWFQAQYRAIYGSDVILDNSTQDGQWIAIQAQAMNASNQSMIAAFNSFSPATAQGAGLSSVVKINGITRSEATYSSCDVIITGAVGTTILNGSVKDTLYSYIWSLPSSVTIPTGGQITVTATCSTAGAVSASPNTLTIINTPTDGWQSVTNVSSASLGQALQTDASLRQQQSASTMIPSVTPLDGMVGAILALAGVSSCKGYENDTDSTDANGIPAHAVSVVVSGGDAVEIATTIANKKTMGAPTYGTTSETVTDSAGNSRSISFFRPSNTNIYVSITLTALAGYTDAIGETIAAQVADYIASQEEGSVIYVTRLYKPATLDNNAGGLTYDLTGIEIGTSSGSLSASNVTLAFNASPVCPTSNITITAS